jgi:hypothetical protein
MKKRTSKRWKMKKNEKKLFFWLKNEFFWWNIIKNENKNENKPRTKKTKNKLKQKRYENDTRTIPRTRRYLEREQT